MGHHAKRRKYLTLAFRHLLAMGAGVLTAICTFDERLAYGEYLMACTLGIVGYYTLHVLLHEGGHLVCGLLSGYHFSSFRVGSFMLLKRDGKWLLRRYYLPGTLGQCLMSPPEWREDMPFWLYNAGGVLANLLTALLLWLLAPTADLFLAAVLRCLALTALLTALTNGIPIKTDMGQNDGRNILDLSRDPVALHSLWVQLKIASLAVEQRGEEVDPAWFVLPENADLSNPLISWILCEKCMSLIAKMDYDAARKHLEEVLASGASFSGVNRLQLIAALALCEMLGENRPEEVDRLLNKATLKQLKGMSMMPGFLCTLYAYMMCRQDFVRAAKLSAQLDRMARNYAFPNAIEAARAQIALIDEKTLLGQNTKISVRRD